MCREVTLKEVAMKRYTGNLVIELEDQNTGTIETVSETNMVTNAVNDILGVNPMGVMYNDMESGVASDLSEYDRRHPSFSKFHYGAGG